MRFGSIGAGLLAGLLAGCIPSGNDEEVGFTGSTTCDEALFQQLVGQDIGVVDGIETPEDTRVLADDAVMTMDHVPERLNIGHQNDGQIVRVWCG